jgi:Family of unknown function (DUF6508)
MIDGVLQFLPLIDEPQPRGPHNWLEHTPGQQAFIQHLYDHGWIVGAPAEYNWGEWRLPDAHMAHLVPWIGTLTPEKLRRLLTGIVRADRFHEGGTPAFDNGWMSAILRRLAELRDATPTATDYAGRRDDLDAVFAEAAEIASRHLDLLHGRKWILEGQLGQVLLTALDPLLPRDLRPQQLQPHDITSWKPTLRALDLVVRQANCDLAAAAELKIENIYESLWDIYKLAAEVGYRVPAYVIVLATTSEWANQGSCCEFFAPGVASHRTREVFDRNRKAWEKLLNGNASARPLYTPGSIETRRVSAVALRRRPELELRIAGIRIDCDPGDFVEFDGDWPAPES